MENISLHGYIRITPSDTGMHEEHRRQEDLTRGKEYIELHKAW